MAKPRRKAQKPRDVKEFLEEVIQVDRVTRVTKGGRQLRFRATVVIGDQKGQIGYGIGKGGEVQQAIAKAVARAKRNLIQVPIYNGTIPHTVQVKFKAAVVLLKPASEGTGIIAGGAVRKMMDLAGVKNVLSKSLGSNNRLNTTKCSYKALSTLRIRPELELDRDKEKAQDAARESKGEASMKKMSKSEAKEKVTAANRAPKKAAAKKPAPKAKTEKKAE